MKLQLDAYTLDILVQGYPGKTVCHGALGWSTVALLRGHGRHAIFDTGPFGFRDVLVARLKQCGLTPADITHVFLSHGHYDHSVNWTMFPNAEILIGEQELAWAVEQPWGLTPVPELYMRELRNWPRLRTLRPDEEIFPGLSAFLAPGHTPGHLVYVIEATDKDVIFAGDAAKNRAEILSRQGYHTYDPELSSASISLIRERWERRPGSILVPGHDVPMAWENGEIRYLDKRNAGVEAWFGETLEQTTAYRICLE